MLKKKNLALSFALTEVSASKVQVFLVKFVSEFEHRCRHFVQYSVARPRFRDVIPSERWLMKRLLTTSLGCGFSWAILFWAKHIPNSAMMALKIMKWKITWKNGFCWFCNGCQVSYRFFSIPPIPSRTNNVAQTQPGCQESFKMAADLSRRISSGWRALQRLKLMWVERLNADLL